MYLLGYLTRNADQFNSEAIHHLYARKQFSNCEPLASNWWILAKFRIRPMQLNIGAIMDPEFSRDFSTRKADQFNSAENP